MESFLTQLSRQETWEEFLAYRLMKGRFNWHEFHEAHVAYARYSDDIILFAPDCETLGEYRNRMAGFLGQLHLEINPGKEHICQPDEAYEFPGFGCHGHGIDISEATRRKMKGKIRRPRRGSSDGAAETI